jgi:FdrA protein
MTARDVTVQKNRYFDSVFLMAVTRRLSDQPGIEKAAVVMGSAVNKEFLLGMGFAAATMEGAGPSDLLVALQGDRDTVTGLLENLDEWLVRPKTELAGTMAISFDDALSRQADSNLAVISVPGEYAAREAHTALDHGMNVFLFSDHVSVEDEIALKQKASDAGLIVMGPDCGTSIIGGGGIGFANVVRRGPIGVVASSGTGLQEFTCLVHRAGSGISHGLGTGSRDLSDAVGGLSTLAAIAALEQDSATTVIAIVSKPPGKSSLRHIVDRLNGCSKPIAACFLGLPPDSSPGHAHFEICSTIDDVVAAALRLAGEESGGLPSLSADQRTALAREQIKGMAADQRYIRGLFAGGTFCYQSQQVMRESGIVAYSNAPLDGMRKLEDSQVSVENTVIDLGADEFTVGTPHPMIDATHRRRRIRAEAQDPEVALLLLDFILGYNASSAPASDLVEAIGEAKRVAEEAGRYLSVVASVCGTDDDPQKLGDQEQILRDAGVVVFASNVQASSFARDIVLQRTGGETGNDNAAKPDG